jgi:adenosine deaminase CECR1
MWMRFSATLIASTLAAAMGQDFSARFEEIRKSVTPQEMYAFFWDMPKGGDIHHHFSLSVRPSEWYSAAGHYYTRVRISNCPDDEPNPLRFRMASKATWEKMSACLQADFVQLSKLDGETKAAWTSALMIDRPTEGRNEFFEVIVPRVAELARDPDLILQVLPRMLQRYSREKVMYVESQFNVGSEAVADRVRQRLAQPDLRDLGTTIRFQGVVIRFRPDAEQLIEQMYSFLDRNRDLWVGINMAGREDNTKGHPLRFLDTYRKMRRKYSGIRISIHGGEVDAPGHEVRDTLKLGAERIGHGVNLITDPDTMLLMRSGRNLVEANLVSNRLLEYAPNLDAHPFIEYLRFGVPVCLNTDDSGVWDSNLTDEYFLASRHFHLTWSEIVKIGRNSLEFSFAQPALKAQLLSRFDDSVQAFEKKYLTSDWKSALHQVRPEPSGFSRRTLLQ